MSDSTLAFDRLDKGRIYARAGIPEYWIINTPDRLIEVYTQPNTNAALPNYGGRAAYSHGSTLTFQLDGQTILFAVADFLP